VWDIRVAEDHADEIGTFREIFEKVKAIPPSLKTLDEDPWYREYCRKMAGNYGKPYPRPFPCGTLVLGFDRRRAELLGHRLDVSTGLCTVELRVGTGTARLEVFTDMARDRVWLRLVDGQGAPRGGVFDRIRVMPDPKTPTEMPAYAAHDAAAARVLGFRQLLPFLEPSRYDKAAGHPRDRAVRLTARTSGPLAHRSRTSWSGVEEAMEPLERVLDGTPLVVESLSVLAQVALARGEAAQAHAQAARAMEVIRSSPDAVEEGEMLARLTWIESLEASGDRPGARAAAAEAFAIIQERVSRLHEPRHRQSLQAIRENARILELARKLGA